MDKQTFLPTTTLTLIQMHGNSTTVNVPIDLYPDGEVADCIVAGFLIPQAPDGSFPRPIVTVRGCCGGGR